MRKPKLVIDADSLCYILGSTCVVDAVSTDFEVFSDEDEDEFNGVDHQDLISEDLGDGVIVESSLTLAKEAVGCYIEHIADLTGFNPKNCELYVSVGSLYYKAMEALNRDKLDLKPNFRFSVSEDLEHGYKHNRSSTKSPAGIVAIMCVLIRDFNAIVSDGCEADDLVCAIARENICMVAALDKDVLYQTEGESFNYRTEEFVDVDAKSARWYKYYQAIVGDTSDGYKGVPRVGKVKACKLINKDMTETELAQATLDAYVAAGLGVKECLATLRLADMHQLKFVGSTDEYYIDLYEFPEGVEV